MCSLQNRYIEVVTLTEDEEDSLIPLMGNFGPRHSDRDLVAGGLSWGGWAGDRRYKSLGRQRWWVEDDWFLCDDGLVACVRMSQN